MIKGESWGSPYDGPPDAVVTGSDADLAAAADAHPGVTVRFEPDQTSDLARAVGLSARETPTMRVPIDGIRLGDRSLAINMVVSGTPPRDLRWWQRRGSCLVTVDGRVVHDGPATTVVVASGQYLAGDDVVPNGHPGDGRLEVQVYAVRGAERHALRARLATGTHVPHPDVPTAKGRRVRVEWSDHASALVVDGRPRPSTVPLFTAEVVPGVAQLLV